MRQYILIVFISLNPIVCFSQKTIGKTLERFNKGTVPYITIKELENSPDVILLDTREKEEFQVSHLKNAIWVGYEKFDVGRTQMEIPDPKTPIVVYCSVGVRSESIGEKLQNAGYSNVSNLYGGIFEWKNAGLTVVDSLNNPTERIHAFSKQWGRLLTKGDKVYTPKSAQLDN